LEALLLSHPQIADSGVIAVKDADENELPRAFISPKAEMMKKILAHEISTANFAREVDAWVTERVRAYLCNVFPRVSVYARLSDSRPSNR
jgi:acyl-coenzyme A synthetase/AMP-(fatty) acid ligase